MNTRFVRRALPLFMLLVVLLLVACQRVADTREEFCSTLSDVGALAVEFKSVKVDQPVDELRTKVETLQEKKENLDRLARLSPGPVLDKVATAADEVGQAVGEVSGNTLGPAAERIQTAGGNLESAYLEIDDAFCAEK